MKKIIGDIDLTNNDGILVEITNNNEVVISNSETCDVLLLLELVEVKPLIKLLEKSLLTMIE